MRKLVVTNLVSLDGYFEGPDKNFMAMPLHPCFDAYNAERLDAAEILLLGANTYRMFAGFWPGAVDHPQVTGDAQRIARRNTEIVKVVVSDSLGPEDIVDWGAETELVRRADAHDRIAALKEADGGDIAVFGSGALTDGLLAAGLVDEVHLMVGPAALGAGTPMFTRPISGLRLIDTRTFEGTHHVVLRYDATSATV